MFTVYILYSEKYQKTYIGFTSDLPKRLIGHNTLNTKGYTVKFRPWIVLHTEEYISKDRAMKREKWLKSGIAENGQRKISLVL